MDLQELADRINARWPNAGAEINGDGLFIQSEIYPTLLAPEESDSFNARVIIWGLERLEELGDEHYPVLYRISPKQYRVSLHDRPVSHGATRAEAVANALFAALQATEQAASSAPVNPDSNSPASDRAEGTKGEA